MIKQLCRYFVALLLIFLFFPCPVHPVYAHTEGEHHTIRVGIFPLEPMNYLGAKGKAQGLFPDLKKNCRRRAMGGGFCFRFLVL
jgi:hypothetical protein